MYKYFCEKCGWKGDTPEIHDIYGDGGYPVCPNAKTGECYIEVKEYQGGSGTFMMVRDVTPVYLNPAHPENMMKFLRAITAAK